MKPNQLTLFKTEDLPLFSGTPMPGHESAFQPTERPEQLRMLSTAPEMKGAIETEDTPEVDPLKAAKIAAYEERRQRRIDRLERAAERLHNKSQAHYNKADQMSSVIPFGQPVMGAADARYRERIHDNMRRGWDEAEGAKELEHRAQVAANNTAIFSDDPNASEKLSDKIVRLEKRQELMKAANKLVRKNDRAGLAEMGFSETAITKLFTPDFCGRVGFPDYAITNNGANIRRLKERLTTIEKHTQDETSEKTLGSVRIVDNVEENRLQIFFPGKPSESIRSELKSNGFRWSPYNGCWQRQRSNGATYWAEQIVEKFNA